MRKKLLLLIIPVLALASCNRTEEPLMVNEETQSHSGRLYKTESKKSIEIDETFSIHVIDFPNISCGSGYYHYGTYYGTCNFSQLGKLEIYGGGCRKNLNSDNSNSWNRATWYGERYASGNNTTLIMPNKDEIYLSNDEFDVTFDDDLSYIAGNTSFDFTITGGTGKYANAEGTLTCNARIKINEEAHVYELKGVLKY